MGDFDQSFVPYDFLSLAKAPVPRKNATTVDVDTVDQESRAAALALLSLSCTDHHRDHVDEEKGDDHHRNGNYKNKSLGFSSEQISNNNISVLELTVGGGVCSSNSKRKRPLLELEEHKPPTKYSKVGGGGSGHISLELTLGGVYSSCAYSKGKRPMLEEHKSTKSSKLAGEGGAAGISLELTLGFNTNSMNSSSSNVASTSRAKATATTSKLVERRRAGNIININNNNNNNINDPWRIRKKLKGSDVGHMSRLLLNVEMVESHVFPFWTPQQVATIKQGVPVRVWDCDTRTEHNLVFKQWSSSGAHVLMSNWNKEFVLRRELKADDEIGLYWDQPTSQFKFSLLNPAPPRIAQN